MLADVEHAQGAEAGDCDALEGRDGPSRAAAAFAGRAPVTGHVGRVVVVRESAEKGHQRWGEDLGRGRASLSREGVTAYPATGRLLASS